MVKDDISEQVDGPGPWALNLVMVPKSNGNVQITTNFLPLNQFVIPDQHPLPRISDLYLQLKGTTIFLKLKVSKGSWHIQLAHESCLLTTKIRPYGLHQHKCLPMGLTNAASVFQSLVSQILLGCKGCTFYLDNISVWIYNKSAPTISVYNKSTFANYIAEVSRKRFLIEYRQILLVFRHRPIS
uniref:Reverse transcriptase n=1 Tax=Romanomermis culicivorax TaxID=13658 RepID=A0A915JEB8_ROMCU